MTTVCHELRVKAVWQAFSSDTGSTTSCGIGTLNEVAQKQAQYQAKLAELRVLRADVFKHLCQRGKIFTLAMEALGDAGYHTLLIQRQISTQEADDCRELAKYADDVDQWAYSLNGEVLITSIKQIVGLVRLWYEQGQPKPEIEAVNSALH